MVQEPDPNRKTGRSHKLTTPAGQPAIVGKDLKVMAKLPLSAAIAWGVPEQHWEKLAAQAVRLERRALDWIARRILGTIGVDRLQAPAEILARRQLTMVRLDQLCFLRSYHPGGWRPKLVLEGREHLDRALAQGQGAILWVAPTVFQWLPAKRTMYEAGYRLHHLSSLEHGFSSPSRFGRAWLHPIRTRIEKRYLAERVVLGPERQSQGALRHLVGLLRQNAVVSITVAPAGARVLRTPLLNGCLSVATGAPHLAARTGAALLPLFTVRTGCGRFLTRVGPPVASPADVAMDHMVAGLARQLEPYVLEHPDQVAWVLKCLDPRPVSEACAPTAAP